MEKKRIAAPNEKCKIFHQTTVMVGWMNCVPCGWKGKAWED